MLSIRKEEMMMFSVFLHSLLRRRAVVFAHKQLPFRLNHIDRVVLLLLRYRFVWSRISNRSFATSAGLLTLLSPPSFLRSGP